MDIVKESVFNDVVAVEVHMCRVLYESLRIL